MKWFKRIGIILVILAVLFVVAGMLLPETYSVSRSTVVAASPQEIHPWVGDLQRWPEWTPWTEIDPSRQTIVGARTTGVGASQSWSGKSGTGELTLVKADPSKGVVFEMTFNEGRYESVGAIRYETVSDGTKVTWSMKGQAGGFLGRYLCLMMDSILGPSFEKGLTKLEGLVEAPADPSPGVDDGSSDPSI